MAFTRTLGRSGIKVSAMGLGCWAIGGPFVMGGLQDGWGEVNDAESTRAIHAAMDLGVNFLDTADAYGIGHSEEVIGRAIFGRRSDVVISTKFGYFGNEATKTLHGTCLAPGYIERACDASLKRLQTDYIDLYFLHVGDTDLSEMDSICKTLGKLCEKGKIRSFGWSTDNVDGAGLFAKNPNCTAIQHGLNVFADAPDMIRLCEEHNLAAVNRSPLAMGMLSGKFSKDSLLTNEDVRGAGHAWVPYFKDGRPSPEFLQKLDGVKDIITSNGRTPAQGALAWIWGRSGNTIPIPGFKTTKQVEENAKAMEFGPLNAGQMKEIDEILSGISNNMRHASTQR